MAKVVMIKANAVPIVSLCMDERHDIPCPLPCVACDDECDPEKANDQLDHAIKKVETL